MVTCAKDHVPSAPGAAILDDVTSVQDPGALVLERLVNMEAPAVVNALLDDFLSRVHGQGMRS